MTKVKVFKLDEEAKIPTRTNSTDAGLDLYAVENVFITKGFTAKVKTGVAIDIPAGYVGRVCDRSGMASKGLIVGAGVIDTGYSGDVSVLLHNFSAVQKELYFDGYSIKKGDKIAQLVIQPIETPEVEVVNTLWTSQRGEKGWGSSGA